MVIEPRLVAIFCASIIFCAHIIVISTFLMYCWLLSFKSDTCSFERNVYSCVKKKKKKDQQPPALLFQAQLSQVNQRNNCEFSSTLFSVCYIFHSVLLPHCFIIIWFGALSCTVPVILNPGCTLESHMALFKKFKYTDVSSPNLDFIGLTEVKTRCHIFETIPSVNDV